MKKICTIIMVLMFAMSSLCFAGISSSGSSKSSSSSSSKPSISTSKPSTPSVNTAKPSPTTPVGTSGGGISTSKTQEKEAELKRTQQAQQREEQNRLNMRNNYVSQPNAGFGGFGSGVMAGLVAGSLLHPTTLVTPVGASAGYVSAPIGFQIIFFIIDILLFALFCYIIYRVWKAYKK